MRLWKMIGSLMRFLPREIGIAQRLTLCYQRIVLAFGQRHSSARLWDNTSRSSRSRGRGTNRTSLDLYAKSEGA